MGTSARKRRRTPAKEPSWNSSRLEEWGLSRGQQRLLMVVASVAGVLVAAVVLTFAIGSIGNDYVPERATTAAIATQPRPDAYKGWVSPKLFAPIAQHKADPTPLTLKDVFAEKVLKEGRITLRLGATKLDAGCSAAVWGQGLVDQLAQAGCTQAARGVYASADGRYIAQYTLLNLRNTAAADALVQSLTALHRGGWTRSLESSRAHFPLSGYTEASGHAMGHYAGLVWIGRADGAEPGVKDDFVSLSLAVRGAEKVVFRRVVAAAPPS
ncbi:hypothetical protein [Streptosporangium sp. NBC_01756]|uniref:hypothetical protein n=1 Tax=Streptosporangium sp. NBC_01756 TaxID=2975950 RepID=UPI002DDA250B|nr:hypothetical protein [Streptosporangium sp. NBC_01756]WSC85134.1 hypothetical protein OIE48_32965 [Streptosporangium sp. NBC_01756]